MKLGEIRGRLRQAVPRPVTWAALRLADSSSLGRLIFALSTGMLDGEVRATLHGLRRHQEELLSRTGAAGRVKLRRCVHRLEKGLIMRPRRDVFGLDYIELAADLYGDLISSQLDEDGLLLERWARDTLDAYFEAVTKHPKIDAARKTYRTARDNHLARGLAEAARDDRAAESRPYRRDLGPLQVSPEGMLELAQRRRSVRWFLPEPVPRELIDQALTIGLYAPSACNRQPFEFRIYDDPARVQEIASIPMGTRGLYENFQCVVVIVGKLGAFAHPRDRHVPYIDASLAAMGFAFGLETLGLASCCINWPDIPRLEKRMRKAIDLRDDEQVVMLMSVGWPDPDGEVPYSQKLALDAARSWNTP